MMNGTRLGWQKLMFQQNSNVYYAKSPYPMGTSALKLHSEQEKHKANVKSKSQLAVLLKKTYGLIAIVTCNNLGVFLQYT